MRKNILAIGIIFLINVSVVTPIAIGNNIKLADSEFEDNLDFYYYKNQTSSKASIYQEHFKQEYSNNDVKVEQTIALDSLKEELSLGPMDSAWPMQSHDLHHTGLSPFSTADNPGIEKWRFKTRYGLDGSPVIDDDGTIYFGALDEYIYALYPNGTMKWRYKTDNWITSAPAVDEDGTIYVGSWDTNLYAIYPNGTLKWKSPGTGGSIASSPAIGEDGTIYFGTLDTGNSIVAVNPNGTIKWSYKTGYSITGAPAIGDDGTVYCGSGDTYFYALNPDGTLKWRFKTGHYIKGPASIADDGTIYFGSWDDYLYALYPNGTMKWRIKVGYGTETNPSIASDGTVYVGGWEYLWAIYPNGTLRWSFFLGEDRHIFKSCPAISADGTIYVGTNIGDSAGGEIIAVNPNGTERWRKQIAEWWVDSSPAIAEDGTVYIGSSWDIGGYLHAFGSVESNSPPDAPSISGETNGKVGEYYYFGFQSFDPDNNPVSFYIDWGDGSTPGWTFELASGEIWYCDHTWYEIGNYTIRAKARDTLYEESNWTEFEIKITNPRNRVSYCYYWLRFLERFPLLQKIFNFLTI